MAEMTYKVEARDIPQIKNCCSRLWGMEIMQISVVWGA